MYNVLITDDEQIVIDSITFIIERNFPGQITVFPARSGTDAVQITRKNQIDIVFMDINMPGLNGLESVQQIRQINTSAVIIILSAFDRFQYAQEAINLGAYKYLTKPVNRNLITQTIRNAMMLVDEARSKIDNDIEIHERLNFVSSIVESDFIYSAVLSGEKNNDLVSYLDYFKVRDQNWFFACIEIPSVLNRSRYDAYMQIRDVLTSFCQCIIGSCVLNRIIVFFPYRSHGSVEDDSKYIRELLNGVYTQVSLKIASGIRIGVGEPDNDIKNTVSAYNTSLSTLNSVPATGGILFYDDIAHVAGTDSGVDVVADIDAILSRLQVGDTSGMTVLVTELFTKLFSHIPDDVDRIKNISLELLINAQNYVRTVYSSYHNAHIDNAFGFLVKKTERSDIELFVTRELSECLSAVIENRSDQMHPIIMRAHEYISEHVCNEVTLSQVAQHIQVSPVYLSRLFKEQTGCNFVDYVTQLRLEKAKEMLQDERLSIKEISNDVGYNDQNYFSRLFRRKFGLTPTEFRSMIYTRRQSVHE